NRKTPIADDRFPADFPHRLPSSPPRRMRGSERDDGAAPQPRGSRTARRRRARPRRPHRAHQLRPAPHRGRHPRGGHPRSRADRYLDREAREVTIDVRYDGEDLAEVAELLSVSPAEVIARHQAATWQVAFAGFAPGFGYLAGDDELFDVPRRSSPRTRVPVGAVALAGEFTGVYPRSSPGGWQLIGRTEARLWDLDRQPPALFVPGTIVRFVEAERESVHLGSSSAADDAAAGAGTAAESNAQETSGTATSEAGHALEVLRPGL